MAETRTCPRCTGPLDRLDLHCPFCGAVFSRLKDADSSRTAPAAAATAMSSPSTSHPASASVSAANSAVTAAPPVSFETASGAAFPSAPPAAVPFQQIVPSPAHPVYRSAVAAPAAVSAPAPPQGYQPPPPQAAPPPLRPVFAGPRSTAPVPAADSRIRPEDPYRAPRSAVSRFDRAWEIQLANLIPADRVRRLLAHFLDYLIVIMPPAFLVGFSGRLNPGDLASEDWFQGGVVALFFFAMLPLLLVNVYFLGKYGQTIGKRALNIRIVRTDGTPASLLRIVFLRFIATQALSAIPYLGTFFGLLDVLFIFGDERRCIHDHFADTVVVVA